MRLQYLLILGMLICLNPVQAQQDEQFTQFMHYRLGFNPAYAGVDPTPNFAAMIRSQWLGFDGAPQTQLLTFNMPLLNQRVGIGASIRRHTIGASENLILDLSYAYRIELNRGYLRLGLMGSVQSIRIDFNELESTQPSSMDDAIPVGMQSKYVPNFGAGIYYHNNNFYFGVSVPRLLENNIDLADSEDIISRQARHFYAMSGLTFGEEDAAIRVTPHFLLKYVVGAPLDADVNVSVTFKNVFTTGVSYRLGGARGGGLGESLSLLMSADITSNILFGLSYDLTVTDLRDYNDGSLEGVIIYRIGGKDKSTEVEGPRPDFFN